MTDITARIRAEMERLGIPANASKRETRDALKRDRQRRDDAAYRSGMRYTRATAKALDLLTYAGGKPCKLGHENRRWVGNGRCVECARNGARVAMRKHRAANTRRRIIEKWVKKNGKLVRII